MVTQKAPARTYGLNELEGLGNGRIQKQLFGNSGGKCRLSKRNVTAQIAFECIKHFELVVNRALDVERFTAERVFTDFVERNHHVFVELEGVGVRTDGCCFAAFMPEGKARLRRLGDKTFAVDFGAKVNHSTDGFFKRGFVVADDVSHDHHLGIIATFALDRIVDCLQVAVVEMFESGKHAALVAIAEEIGNFQNGFTGQRCRAEELQADRVGQRRHFVQNPARRGDDAVGAFFLNRRQAA